MTIRALTLTQPYATLIAIGAKKLESRSWRTDYRGLLAIHAAKGLAGMTKREYVQLCESEPFRTALMAGGYRAFLLAGPDMVEPWRLPFGAVVAVGELADCLVVPHAGITRCTNGVRLPPTEPERSFGDYSPGRYAWRLENVRALATPIPAKGALGLWTWEPSAELLPDLATAGVGLRGA